MAHPTFEALAESSSGRQATRRGALAASVAGALGLAGVTGAAAQDATPEAESTSTDPMFLFVQLAEKGTWIPSPDDPEVYYLTLTGLGSQVAFFSDRPERIVGTVNTTRFFDALGFTPANPPNAAAVVRTPEGERDVLIVELFDPVYTQEFDADGGVTVRYSARVLDAYHGANLTSWYEEQDDPELPSQFDQVSLHRRLPEYRLVHWSSATGIVVGHRIEELWSDSGRSLRRVLGLEPTLVRAMFGLHGSYARSV